VHSVLIGVCGLVLARVESGPGVFGPVPQGVDLALRVVDGPHLNRVGSQICELGTCTCRLLAYGMRDGACRESRSFKANNGCREGNKGLRAIGPLPEVAVQDWPGEWSWLVGL